MLFRGLFFLGFTTASFLAFGGEHTVIVLSPRYQSVEISESTAAPICKKDLALLLGDEQTPDVPRNLIGKQDLSFTENKQAIITGTIAENLLHQNGYKVLKFIGKGGQAVTYSVQTPEGKIKAVKVAIQKGAEREARLLKELAYEARVMHQLHSIDPRFLDAELKTISNRSGSKISFLEMDLVGENAEPAQNLHDLLRNDLKYITPARYQSIRQQLGELMEKAASAGIYHLDLKPNNILIQKLPNGEPKVTVLDWGLSSWERKDADSPARRHKRFLFGTLGYIPPERYVYAASPGPVNEKDTDKKQRYDFRRSDPYALRNIYWKLGFHLQPDVNENGMTTYRHKNPKMQSQSQIPTIVPEEDYESSVGLASTVVSDSLKSSKLSDSSGNKDGGYSQPTISLIGFNPREDVIRLAEWTRWPNNVQEQNALIRKAETILPEKFLEEFGPKLLALDSRIANVMSQRNSHREAALEILSSRLLLKKLFEFKGKTSALGLNREHTMKLVNAVAAISAESSAIKKGFFQIGPVDPGPQLLYEEFQQEYEKFRNQQIIPLQAQKQSFNVMPTWRQLEDQTLVE